VTAAIATGTTIAAGLFGLAMLLCLWRLARGPTVADRILALDTLYVNALALLLTLGIRYSGPVPVDAALLIALLGFFGTVAFARYRLKGDIID
jgi:multicomponent K+:H+ antiporter subunit F